MIMILATTTTTNNKYSTTLLLLLFFFFSSSSFLAMGLVVRTALNRRYFDKATRLLKFGYQITQPTTLVCADNIYSF